MPFMCFMVQKGRHNETSTMELETLPPVHWLHLPDHETLNATLLARFDAVKDDPEHRRSHTLSLSHDPEEEMLRTKVVVVETRGLLTSEVEHASNPGREVPLSVHGFLRVVVAPPAVYCVRSLFPSSRLMRSARIRSRSSLVGFSPWKYFR